MFKQYGKKRFAVILLVGIVVVVILVIYLWITTDNGRKNVKQNQSLESQKVKFLDYSITLPDGWKGETKKEVVSKYYKNDPIFGNTCITSQVELKRNNYKSNACHFLKINGDNDKFIIITDTNNISLGGGGDVPTTTIKELISISSFQDSEVEFNFVYEGPSDNILGLYYATGCFNKNFCLTTSTGVGYSEFKDFIVNFKIN